MDYLFALVYWLSLFFHYEVYFYPLAALAFLYLFKAGADKRVLFLSVLLTLVMIFALKPFYDGARPCVDDPGLVACPPGGGFPSAHAALSFVLALNALGLAGFPLFFAAALFISFSRVFLGVHSTGQVLAGIALASVIYFLVLEIRDKTRNKVKGK